jgi:hypothetical protein
MQLCQAAAKLEIPSILAWTHPQFGESSRLRHEAGELSACRPAARNAATPNRQCHLPGAESLLGSGSLLRWIQPTSNSRTPSIVEASETGLEVASSRKHVHSVWLLSSSVASR